MLLIVSDSGGCRDGFALSIDSCYQVNTDLLSRSDAADSCTMAKTHLTDITSVKEQEFVANLLAAQECEDAWFGLRLNLVWSDGSTLLPGSWYDIVSNGPSTCFQLENQGIDIYRWTSIQACENAHRYVCEYEGMLIE